MVFLEKLKIRKIKCQLVRMCKVKAGVRMSHKER